jgi:hypothetical protein
MSGDDIDNGHNIEASIGEKNNNYKHPVIFHKWFWYGMPLVNFEIVREHVEKRENL